MGRAGNVERQLDAAWEQTMQQTFVNEATLLGMMIPPPDPPQEP